MLSIFRKRLSHNISQTIFQRNSVIRKFIYYSEFAAFETVIYRILEKRLGEQFTCHQIIRELREMYLLEIPHEGYIPTYTRTDFTDTLHDTFGFRIIIISPLVHPARKPFYRRNYGRD